MSQPVSDRFVQVPTDSERSAGRSFSAGSLTSVPIEGDPHDRGTDQARARQVAAIVALLHRYTHQTAIGLDVRASQGAAPHAQAVDVGVEEGTTLGALIDRTRTVLQAAPSLSASGTPASNVALTFGPSRTASPSADDLRAIAGDAAYDAHFVFVDAEGGPALGLVYDAALLAPDSASRLLRSAVLVLGACTRAPETPIARLPLLDADELLALAALQESGTAAYPRLVPRVFAAVAAERPSAVAVRFGEAHLTYAELDARSSRLAHYLVAQGVGAEVTVAVCVRPSLDIVVAMLAIWKSRGVYLPLDPTHPEAHVTRMLDEARPRVVLTTSALSALTARFPQLLLDAVGAWLAAGTDAPPEVEARADDAAYLFYTSGTTGRPKGVVATQGNLAQYIHSAAHRYGFSSSDAFVSLARYTFSISLFELVSPLCCGASLRILERDEVLTPDRLVAALADVTVIHAGPSLLGSLFRYLAANPSVPQTLPRMRHASSGGDIVAPSIMEGMKRVFSEAELFVIYGCTEISCMGTTFPIARDQTVSRTFVGKAFPNVAVRVLDANRAVVPLGVVGEIAFSGAGVVRGYLDRPDLTAEKFVESDGARIYATGDMGRLHADGHIEILGRRDFQVQLRGIRVELAGIERTIVERGLAAQCAVVARAVGEGDLRLVAFVVQPAAGGPAAVRRALGAELPDYMVPHHIVPLDAMPLTANGKLDRNRLKEIPWENAPATSTAAKPATAREREIAGIFARTLGRKEVGLDDGFFDLGGDSLLCIVALDAIARSTGVKIPTHVLFEAPTVRALAAYAEGGAVSGGDPHPVALNRMSGGPPVFMLSGVQIYRPLAAHLEGICSPYGVYVRSEVDAFLDRSIGAQSIEDMAREYLASIRRQQPRGPYRLVGYSFGGIVAYEVAQRLRAEGEEIRLLALMDPQLPEWTLGWRFRLAQLGRLRSASPKDVATFVARRLKLLPTPPEFVRRRDDANLGQLEAHMDHLKRESAAAYLPRLRSYPENVTLFVAAERLRADPLKSASCGWDPYVASLAIHRVDADHFAMMDDEPYVGQIARVLADAIAKA